MLNFIEKSTSRSNKKYQTFEVKKFPKFCRKFYTIVRALQFFGMKNYGGEKVCKPQRKLLKKFMGIFFLEKKASNQPSIRDKETSTFLLPYDVYCEIAPNPKKHSQVEWGLDSRDGFSF